MKKTTRMILFLLLITVLASCLCLGVFAESADLKNQNVAYGREKNALLEKRIYEHYYEKAGDIVSAETSTGSVIYGYEGRITALLTDETLVVNEDLTDDIDLIYNKGMSAGILSWIYYSHSGSIDISRVKDVYEIQLAVIDGKTDPAADIGFFVTNDESAPEVEECYSVLLNAIYTERLVELKQTGDSTNVTTIIDNAILTVGDSCGYTEVDGEGNLGEDAANYKSYYDGIVRLVEIQRNRDAADGEMRDIFKKLYPNESFEESNLLTNFHVTLKTKSDAKEMNSLLESTVVELLGGLKLTDSSFRNAYLDGKANETAATVRQANNEADVSIADVSAVFDGYSLELYGADKKDELDLYVGGLIRDNNYPNDRAESLKEIADEYTDADGFIDGAVDEAGIDAELTIAKTRCDWFVILCDTEDAIGLYDGDNTKPLADARTQYEATDEAIKAGERDGDGSFDSRRHLADDIEKMITFVTDAEVIKFNTDHKAIIETEKSDITSADKADISDAIADAHRLSKPAQVILEGTLNELGEKYKAAVTDEVDSYRKDDGARTQRDAAADRIGELIEALSAKDENGNFDLPLLKHNADVLADKAKQIDAVLDTYADEYLSGEGREFSENAERTVDEAVDGIVAATDGSEAEKKADAIVELQRLAALEDIYAEAEGHEAVEGIPELLENARTEIGTKNDKAAIDSYAQGEIAEIRELVRLDEIDKAKKELDLLVDEIKKEIGGYGFITEEQKNNFLSEVTDKRTAADTALEGAADAEGVRSALTTARDELESIRDNADMSERDACLTSSKNALDEIKQSKDDYSAENYATILELIDEYKEKLNGADSVAEFVAIRDEGLSRIDEVEDLLETAKRLGKEKLTAAYGQLMESKDRYSAENLGRLQEIYDHSMAEIDMFAKISDAQTVGGFVDERIALMKGVYLDKLYTSDGLFMGDSDPDRPEGYDPYANGFSGAVISEGGISHNMVLTMSGVSEGGIAEQLKNAAKNKLVCLADGSAAGRDVLKALRNCFVVASVDISLGEGDTLAGKDYTVSILLPDGVDMSRVLGVVFLREDGSVEFYEMKGGETGIEFTTDHFSKYYVVSSGDINLLPWIICLSIIILCELVIIAILLIRRRSRGVEIDKMYAIVSPMALSVVYKPKGGMAVITVLGALAIALAAVIAYLLYLEIRDGKARRQLTEGEREKKEEKEENAENAVPVSVTPAADEADGEAPDEHGEVIVHSVTVEEAEALMTDSEVKAIQEEIQKSEYEDTEVYRGAKRAEINIDVISEMFEDGDTVTLNSLKEKKLVGSSVGFVKVLARGRLDKSLTVVAQDFSAAAIKMILLTGGKAIVTHASPERTQKKGK